MFGEPVSEASGWWENSPPDGRRHFFLSGGRGSVCGVAPVKSWPEPTFDIVDQECASCRSRIAPPPQGGPMSDAKDERIAALEGALSEIAAVELERVDNDRKELVSAVSIARRALSPRPAPEGEPVNLTETPDATIRRLAGDNIRLAGENTSLKGHLDSLANFLREIGEADPINLPAGRAITVIKRLMEERPTPAPPREVLDPRIAEAARLLRGAAPQGIPDPPEVQAEYRSATPPSPPSPEDRGAEEAAREFFGCWQVDDADEVMRGKHSGWCRMLKQSDGPEYPHGCEKLTALLLRRDREALGRAALWCREYADIVANQPILKATPFQIAMACAERIEALGARAIEAERGGK